MYTKVARTFRELGVDFSTEPSVLSKYATDESVFSIMPQMVVTPHSVDEIQKIVRTVADYAQTYPDISLTVRSAGTGLSGGSLNDSIIVDIQKEFIGMDEIQINEKETEATMWVRPGTYFRDFDAETKKSGFFFPPYLSSRDICTIGGMVVNNGAGPNSLKYGPVAEFTDRLKVVLHDGELYEFGPLTYKELENELEQQDARGDLYRHVWGLIENGFEDIKKMEPTQKKNSAGYAVWDVLNAKSVTDFKKGKGIFNMVRVFTGSQGTIGIITDIQTRLIPHKKDSDLLIVPIFDINNIGQAIIDILKENPYNVEVFDKKTFGLALKNPMFFKNFFKQVGDSKRQSWLSFTYWLYKSFAVRFKFKTPEFILMVIFDRDSQDVANEAAKTAAESLKKNGYGNLELVTDDKEEDMFWRVRASSFSLAKLGKANKRPAAFLEDMVIPPEQLPDFLNKLQAKLKEYDVEYAVHGHGGDGHFHFYPLFDFTDDKTPERIFRMAEDFFNMAVEHGGNICGEHNDGIIRTPFLSLIFKQEALDMFKELEKQADPDDIFNPGKKVNPKFDIRGSIRTTN